MAEIELSREEQTQPATPVAKTRSDVGHALLVVAGQFALIAIILMVWVGQDLSYSPGWAHPIAYYFALLLALLAVCGVAGFLLRRGARSIG
jgi:nitrate reductase gamma subunit